MNPRKRAKDYKHSPFASIMPETMPHIALETTTLDEICLKTRP